MEHFVTSYPKMSLDSLHYLIYPMVSLYKDWILCIITVVIQRSSWMPCIITIAIQRCPWMPCIISKAIQICPWISCKVFFQYKIYISCTHIYLLYLCNR